MEDWKYGSREDNEHSVSSSLPAFHSSSKPKIYFLILLDAKKMNLNISVLFHNDYQNILDFEKQSGVKLPDDITTMLMLQEQKTQTQLIEESLFQPPSKNNRRSFEDIAKKLTQQKGRTQIQSAPNMLSQTLRKIEHRPFAQ